MISNFTTEKGFIGTIMSFLIGLIPDLSPATQTQLTFWFQLTAFSVSIVVGIITIYHVHLKLCDRKKRISAEKEAK